MLSFFGCDEETEGQDDPACERFAFAEFKHAGQRFDGVDFLVVVDKHAPPFVVNRLSQAIYDLITNLTNPSAGTGQSPIHNIRLAVVSSDMGLQWGEQWDDAGQKSGGNTGENTTPVTGCVQDRGDNGGFLTPEVSLVAIDGEEVSCPFSSSPYLATTVHVPNPDIAAMGACAVRQSGDGCLVTQPLEAAIRGLEIYASPNASTRFVVESHLLNVVVVSAEDDCSIKNPGLFATDAWQTSVNTLGNGVCASPHENDGFLFPVDESESGSHNIYRDRFIEIKGGKEEAVLFTAVVGVPTDDEVGDPCQGYGTELSKGNCLQNPAMEVTKSSAPTCQAFDASGELAVTASPGRRFVRAAKTFGTRGYVTSICNDTWTQGMLDVAQMIRSHLDARCFEWSLPWEPDETKCRGCGAPPCDLVVQPTQERDPFTIPALMTPLDCEAAAAVVDQSQVGWYYCEAAGDSVESPCRYNVKLTEKAQESVDGDSLSVQCSVCSNRHR